MQSGFMSSSSELQPSLSKEGDDVVGLSDKELVYHWLSEIWLTSSETQDDYESVFVLAPPSRDICTFAEDQSRWLVSWYTT